MAREIDAVVYTHGRTGENYEVNVFLQCRRNGWEVSLFKFCRQTLPLVFRSQTAAAVQFRPRD